MAASRRDQAAPKFPWFLWLGKGGVRRDQELRLTEALRLRVKDVDFSFDRITVRDGKGGRSRVTMLPATWKPLLAEHLRRVQRLHDRDLAEGHGAAPLPYALARKYPAAPREWAWRLVFPAAGRWTDPKTGEQHRHHLHERRLQRAFRAAVQGR